LLEIFLEKSWIKFKDHSSELQGFPHAAYRHLSLTLLPCCIPDTWATDWRIAQHLTTLCLFISISVSEGSCLPCLCGWLEILQFVYIFQHFFKVFCLSKRKLCSLSLTNCCPFNTSWSTQKLISIMVSFKSNFLSICSGCNSKSRDNFLFPMPNYSIIVK
jgi:hypothetical protein